MEDDKKRPQTALEKQFFSRNSKLTDLLASGQSSNLHVLYGVVFVCLSVKAALRRFVKTGSLSFGLDVMRIDLFNSDKAVLIWLCLFASACSCFFLLKIWATCRHFDIARCLYIAFSKHPVHKTPNYSKATKMWDLFFVTLLVTYYIYSFILTNENIRYYGLHFHMAVLVSAESVRFLMKVHSFVRNNAANAINNNITPRLPSFSHFLYFLFAPTLIYKDSYPMRRQINWNYVWFCLLALISQIFMCCIIADIVSSNFQEYDLQKITISGLILIVVENVFFGGIFLIILVLFYSHFLQNLFAELSRFDDRHFYGDWWNSCHFESFLRKSNYIIEEWLYYYVYLDFKNKVYNNKNVAKLAVFIGCFVVHKWITCLTAKGGFPVIFFTFIVFVFPTIFISPPKNIISRVLSWYFLCILTTINIFVYCIEYYVWKNVLLEIPTTFELFLPRFSTCDCVL